MTSQTYQHLKNSALIYNKRIVLLLILLFIWGQPHLRPLLEQVLADAFLQVSVFVAMTLCVYYSISFYLDTKPFQTWIKTHPFREVIVSAFLGVLPGCGGAIIVITQYTQGRARFGSVVAVLTSTMGDAAFLLISQRPVDAIIVLSISFSVGVLSGLFTHTFLPHPTLKAKNRPSVTSPTLQSKPAFYKNMETLSILFWAIVLVPAGLFAFLLAFQIDPDAMFHLPAQTTQALGALGGAICLIFWATHTHSQQYCGLSENDHETLPQLHWLRKVAKDTQFVTTWVIVAFLLFEMVFLITDSSLLEQLQHWSASSILISAIVGLIPGCGPQIIVTSWYLQGHIPLSAQIANSLSNDGDALFPAIALAPKAALYAVIYTTVPAIIVGYGYFWLFE